VLLNDGYADPVDLTKSTGYKALWLLLMGLAFVVAFIWSFRIWRTYRELNGVSPGRSALTFVIFASLSPVAIALHFSMAASLSGASPPLFPRSWLGSGSDAGQPLE